MNGHHCLVVNVPYPLLGHPQFIIMFASDERVSAHGSENSAGKEKTGKKISGGAKKSAEGR